MKNNKIQFVTLFPKCPNVGLVKDVGQIPYNLGKYENIETALISSELDLEGNNLDKVPGLKIVQVPIFAGNAGLTGAIYLIKNAKSIDWLNIYHCGRKAFYWTKLFKFLNPYGKVYLKLDLDFISCHFYDTNKNARNAFKKITSLMDLVSVESIAVKKRIQPYARCDIKLLSNGYCNTEKPFDVTRKRENTFLTVGRLGTKQKATESLLEAFARSANTHNWILKLVGSIEPEFEMTIKQFFRDYPHLHDRVIFTGIINDRHRLYKEYCSAKVFVLPSRWESFGLVGPEALSCGCKIILSDQIPPMYEVTNNEKYGKIVPVDDINALAMALSEAAEDEYTAELSLEIADYAKENFSWEKICEKLYQFLLTA